MSANLVPEIWQSVITIVKNICGSVLFVKTRFGSIFLKYDKSFKWDCIISQQSDWKKKVWIVACLDEMGPCGDQNFFVRAFKENPCQKNIQEKIHSCQNISTKIAS
jgi:hypothetical protein